VRAFLCIVLTLALAACSSNKPPAHSAAECVKKGARTGVAGAKTGVETGVEGVKAAGSAVGGFFEGGADESGKKWKEGKAETKRVAHTGAEETKHESQAPNCP